MVRVTVPATSANMGSGYDSIGIALELYNVIDLAENDHIDISDKNGQYVPQDESNLIYQCAKRVYDECGKPLSSLNRQDFEGYLNFLADPQPAQLWCGPKADRRTEKWRPFVGPLSESAVLTAIAAAVTATGRAVTIGAISRASCCALGKLAEDSVPPNTVATSVPWAL